MSRRWLSIALLLFSSCYRSNPINCVASPSACGATEICDTATERCINPTLIACGSTDCPTGSVCDQATMRCAQELNIISIDKPYIKSSGGEVVTIKGTGFVQDSIVLFNGVPGSIDPISSTELRITTPSRPPGTPCGRLPLRVTNPSGAKKTVDAFFSYYTEDALFTPSALTTTLSQGAERLVLADLTQDGKNDLMFTISGNRANVLTGSTSGFEPGFASFAAANATFAIADVRPGRNFVLTTDRLTSNFIVYKLMGGATLSYSQVGNFTSMALDSLVLVDLNADNDLDAIGLYTSGQIVNLVHDGAWGSLQGISAYSPMSLTGAKAQSVAAGIYYGNKPIIASTNRSSSVVDLAEFNPTTRTFSSAGFLQSVSNILSVFDGDFNGDGKKDLAVFHGSGSARIFYNDNGFDSARTKDINFSVAISGATVGDLDCDGVTDLIGLNSNGASPGVLFWTERSPNLAMFPLFDRGMPLAAAVGDINSDLLPDLVVYSSPTAALNRIGPP